MFVESMVAGEGSVLVSWWITDIDKQVLSLISRAKT